MGLVNQMKTTSLQILSSHGIELDDVNQLRLLHGIQGLVWLFCLGRYSAAIAPWSAYHPNPATTIQLIVFCYLRERKGITFSSSCVTVKHNTLSSKHTKWHICDSILQSYSQT